MTVHNFARRISPAVVIAAMLVAAATSAQASVEISSKPTHNMNCSGGVCTPTAKNADLNATDLANMLATGDVKVTTGSGAVTITVSSSFSWTSTHRLTLDAYYNVSFRAPVDVAGQGAVTIVTNGGGTGGDLIFFEGGKLDFWDLGSSLIINGTAFTIVNDIATLASDIANNPAGFYALAKDYDASVDGTYASSPVATPLAGTFDGLGHSIANLHFQPLEGSKTGLFAQISAGGLVRDLNLDMATVTGIGRANFSFGTVAAQNSGTISNVTVELSANFEIAKGYLSAGGVASQNDGTIIHCASSGEIQGRQANVGGLVSYNAGAIISSSSSIRISVKGGAGELVWSNEGTITLSNAVGTVRGKFAGGIVMQNLGTIDRSFATAEVHGSRGAGGLVGNNFGNITNSYATGEVSMPYNLRGEGAAGFAVTDSDPASITSSYSIGFVNARRLYAGAGFIYLNNLLETNDYWDTDTSKMTQGCANANCPGITGLTTAQFRSGLPAGFDPAIWAQSASINNGYPYLLANPPPQ